MGFHPRRQYTPKEAKEDEETQVCTLVSTRFSFSKIKFQVEEAAQGKRLIDALFSLYALISQFSLPDARTSEVGALPSHVEWKYHQAICVPVDNDAYIRLPTSILRYT